MVDQFLKDEKELLQKLLEKELRHSFNESSSLKAIGNFKFYGP